MKINALYKKTVLLLLLLLILPWMAQAGAPAVTALGALASPLTGPARVATDSAGRIYTTDPTAGKVAVLDAFGRVLEVHSGFARPLAITVDAAGRIYLSEERLGSVSVLDSRWQLLSQLGGGANEFKLPGDIALDPSAANTVYVCDSGAQQIKVYVDGLLSFAFGSQGAGDGQFDFPSGVFVSAAGEVFVVDQNNDRVEVFDRNGAFKRKFALKTTGGMSMGISGRAQGITGDSQGRLYIADAFQGQIKVFSQSGAFICTLGSYGQSAGQLRSPAGITVDVFGRLLVASVNNGRVELLGLDSYIQLTAAPAKQTVAAGTDVSFGATISGSGSFAYQWYKGGNALSDGWNVSGATSPRLILANTAPMDSGDYSVIITGTDGTFSSPAATLTVLTPPTITSQTAAFTVLSGTSLQLSSSVTGDNLSYQWKLNGVDISGATSNSLNISGASTGNSGRYTLVASNALGSVTNNVAELTVLNSPSLPKNLTLAPMSIDGMHLFFDCEPGFNYTVEGSTDLSTWSQLGTVVGDTAPIEFVDPDALTLSGRFYRVRWQP